MGVQVDRSSDLHTSLRIIKDYEYTRGSRYFFQVVCHAKRSASMYNGAFWFSLFFPQQAFILSEAIKTMCAKTGKLVSMTEV